MTPDPDLERSWMATHPDLKIAAGDRAYPMGVADRLVKSIQSLLPNEPITLRQLESLTRKALRKEVDYPPSHWLWLDANDGDLPFLSEEEREILHGKLLSGGELTAFFRFQGSLFPAEVERKLHVEVLVGRARRLPGIGRDDWGRVVCRRCGEYHDLSKSPCVFCGAECWICHSCNALGTVRECIPIYQFSSESPLEKEIPVFEMKSPKLTAVQEEAAKKVRTFTREAKSSEFLVWAVCGAGKTEVTFPAIADAIQRGQRVLYAVPRRDVVKEIGIRMEQAFPGIRLAVLYGGEGRKEEVSPHLTIATTHQVLRFVDHFHLAILDEADAYPYEGSRMLRYGLRRAVRAQGKLIYLTATPTRELRERAYGGGLEFVTIPARHHGYPLPEPILATDRLASMVKDDCKVSGFLEEFLAQARQVGAPVLIYLPTVEQVEGFGKFLKERGKRLGWNTDWVHAEAAHRDQAVMNFRQGLTSILVSSTILERGVNFPGVDVIVVHADHEQVFDVETLVQLAGRAGRFAERPRGRVVFLGKRISKPMREAKEWIEKMNGEAAGKGLLIKEGRSFYE